MLLFKILQYSGAMCVIPCSVRMLLFKILQYSGAMCVIPCRDSAAVHRRLVARIERRTVQDTGHYRSVRR